MPFKPATIFCMLICCACNNAATAPVNKTKTNESTANIATDKNPYPSINAIPLPEGYKRVKTDSHSFAAWLEKVQLKENKTVYLFNGDEKINQQAQFAVLDISVSNKNLQQCADAVMRLRANTFLQKKGLMKLFLQITKREIILLILLTQKKILQNLWKGFLACAVLHHYQNN
jgi:Domain of unknown function (4846)